MGFIGLLLWAAGVYVWVCVTRYPHRLMNKKTGLPYTKQEVKYHLIVVGVFGFIFLALAGAEKPAPETAQQVIASSGANSDGNVSISTTENGAIAIEPVREVVKLDLPSLGMTPEQFRIGLNQQLKNADVSYMRPIGEFDLKVSDDGESSFNVAFSDAVGLVGSANKNGEVDGLTYIMAKSDQAEKAAMDVVLLAALTARVLNPDVPKEVTSKSVLTLMTKAAKGLENENNSHQEVHGGIKYFAIAGSYTGLWMGFEPVDMKQ